MYHTRSNVKTVALADWLHSAVVMCYSREGRALMLTVVHIPSQVSWKH